MTSQSEPEIHLVSSEWYVNGSSSAVSWHDGNRGVISFDDFFGTAASKQNGLPESMTVISETTGAQKKFVYDADATFRYGHHTYLCDDLLFQITVTPDQQFQLVDFKRRMKFNQAIDCLFKA